MRCKKALAVALMMLFALSACGPKGPGSNFKPQYYPECFDPIERLCKDKDGTEKAKSAGKGAALGALGGALIGLLTTGKAEGALVGAAAGAAAGGLTGLIYQSYKDMKDQRQRLEAFQQALGEEGRNLDLQHASVLKSFRCYQAQIDIVKKRYKSGKMSKEDAKARMDEIHKGIDILKQYWEERSSEFESRASQADKFIDEQDRLATRSDEKARVSRARQTARANTLRRQKQNDEVAAAYQRASQAMDDIMA